MYRKKIFVALLILFMVIVAGCTGDFLDDGVDTDNDTGQLALFIADNAVNDLEHVYVYIDEVNVQHEDGGWETINDFKDEEGEMLKVDLLKLRFTEEKLGDKVLQAGNYNKIRLKLAADYEDLENSEDEEMLSRLVFKDEVDRDDIPLKVPAGSQKGFQIDYDFSVEGDIITELIIDVDLTKLVFAGQSGKALLNTQAINVIEPIYAGNIVGEVYGETKNGDDEEISAEPIQDIDDRDVFIEAYDFEDYDEDAKEFDAEPLARSVALNDDMEDEESEREPGEFMLRGLTEGEYMLRAFVGYRDDEDDIQVDTEKYELTILDETVSVIAGEKTKLDTPIILPLVDSDENDSGEDTNGDNSEDETD